MHETLNNVECETRFEWTFQDMQAFNRKQRELRLKRRVAGIIVLFVVVCLIVACAVTALALLAVAQGGGR